MIGVDLFNVVVRSLISPRLLIDLLKIVEVILAINYAGVELTQFLVRQGGNLIKSAKLAFDEQTLRV